MAVVDLIAGFSDPVRDSAITFRAILNAMARPGRITFLPVMPPVPNPMNGGAVCVALSLLDSDTPVWLGQGLRSNAVCDHLRFHTGAPIIDDPAQARFAFFDASEITSVSGQLPVGTPDYPDRSATAVVMVPGFSECGGACLTGPGVDVQCRLAPNGITSAAWGMQAQNAELYPLGIDTIFAGPDSLAALPRSTRLTDWED